MKVSATLARSQIENRKSAKSLHPTVYCIVAIHDIDFLCCGQHHDTVFTLLVHPPVTRLIAYIFMISSWGPGFSLYTVTLSSRLSCFLISTNSLILLVFLVFRFSIFLNSLVLLVVLVFKFSEYLGSPGSLDFQIL